MAVTANTIIASQTIDSPWSQSLTRAFPASPRPHDDARRRAELAHPAAPHHLDGPVEPRERECGGLGLDRVARRTRQAPPRLGAHRVGCAAPRSADLPVHEERAGPHAGRPQLLPLVGPRNQELTLRS